MKGQTVETCPKCKSDMKKGGKLNSGNSTFIEWICPLCGAKIMKAIGVN